MKAQDFPHLEGLNTAQKAAVLAPAPQLVLAGAGSGKTETLTRRVVDHILRRGTPPERLLCITFTAKAASEMRERLSLRLERDAVPRWVGTFHAVMARLLLEDGARIPGLPRGFSILGPAESRAMLLRAGAPQEGRELAAMQDAVSLLKNSMLRPGAAWPRKPAFARFDEDQLRQAQALLPAYRAELERRNALDFDDLILIPVQAMQRDDALAERWSARWEEILVDEYQDTNAAQIKLIRFLAGKASRIFAVGDDFQAIYGWRGADVGHIRGFARHHPAAPEAIRLEQNYRSTTTILTAANAISARDPQALRKVLRPGRPDVPSGAPLMLRDLDSPQDEGRAVAAHLHLLRRAEPSLAWRDCAVLVRAGFVAEPILAALREAAIPVRRIMEREAEAPRDILAAQAWLRLAMSGREGRWDPGADDAFRRACAFPARGIPGRLFARLREHAAETGMALAAAIGSLPAQEEERALLRHVTETATRIAEDVLARRLRPEDALQVAATESGIAAGMADASPARLANWEAAFSAAARAGSVAAYCDAIALDGLSPEVEPPDAVAVMTLHRAKGLEFDHVLLAGLEDGVFPVYHAEAQGSLPEERRLFYVGLTRARRSLWLSWVRHRQNWTAKPSRFIAEIPPALFKASPQSGAAGKAKPARKVTEAERDRLVAEFHARGGRRR